MPAHANALIGSSQRRWAFPRALKFSALNLKDTSSTLNPKLLKYESWISETCRHFFFFVGVFNCMKTWPSFFPSTSGRRWTLTLNPKPLNPKP